MSRLPTVELTEINNNQDYNDIITADVILRTRVISDDGLIVAETASDEELDAIGEVQIDVAQAVSPVNNSIDSNNNKNNRNCKKYLLQYFHLLSKEEVIENNIEYITDNYTNNVSKYLVIRESLFNVLTVLICTHSLYILFNPVGILNLIFICINILGIVKPINIIVRSCIIINTISIIIIVFSSILLSYNTYEMVNVMLNVLSNNLDKTTVLCIFITISIIYTVSLYTFLSMFILLYIYMINYLHKLCNIYKNLDILELEMLYDRYYNRNN